MSFPYMNPMMRPQGGQQHPRGFGGRRFRGPWGRPPGFMHQRGGRGAFGSFGEDRFFEDSYAPPQPMPMVLQPGDVMAWLDHQHPFVLKRVLFHARWLLEQHGVPAGAEDEALAEEEESGEGDTSGWYDEEAIQSSQQQQQADDQPPPSKIIRHPGLGWHKNPMQWTPAGWVVKDNSHKITSTMRPLPERDILPPMSSTTYPEVNADRDKLRMLKNNVGMMQFELNKICRKFRIGTLNKDDLTAYPEDQQQRLKTAITCVAAAEKTLEEFTEFLKEEKYQEWNEEQKKKQEEKIKEMIGATPDGVPHKRANVDNEEEDADDAAVEKQFNKGDNL